MSCLFYILFFTNMLDPMLREKEHFLHDAVGAPGGSEKQGMCLVPPAQSVFHIRRGHMVSWHL